MPPRINLVGQRFGRLTVLEYTGSRGSSGALWRCRCDCGNEIITSSAVLRRGTSRSCGCLRREVTTARSTIHGDKPRKGASGTYQSWQNMIKRTTDPTDPHYPRWGGRGITVCDRWRNDYRAFLGDMGPKPRGLTLERKDNDGPYEPRNCVWATPAEQARNQRRTKLTPERIREVVRLHDSGLTVGQVAEQVGIDRHSIGTILAVARALATP